MAASALVQTHDRTRTFILCPWTTFRGNSGVAINLVQDDRDWLDLSAFNDVTLQIDVAEVTNPSGASAGYVLLYVESSPTRDEPGFQTVAGPIVCTPTAATTPLIAKTASAGRAPLARFLRLRIVPTGPASTFDVTLRVRVSANRARYFAPTQLGGCLLWLRADHGLSFNGTTISGWADLSGNHNDAAQSNSANQPAHTALGMNGFPAIVGDGSSAYMTTSAFAIGSSGTLIAAVQPTATIGGYVRILEQQYDHTYYLGTDGTGSKYKLIVNNASSPFGTAEGGTVAVSANTLVTGAYSSPTGIVYVNGTAVGSGSFSAPTSSTQPLWLMQAYNGFNEYWHGYLSEVIVFNRTLSSLEFTRVHRYLGARYGISVP